MDLGGYVADEERVFLLSTTHGAETHSLAAALATMNVYRAEPVIEHLYAQGKRLQQGINQVVSGLGLESQFGTLGRPCNLVFYTRDHDGNPSQPFRTLFLQEMMKRGVIAPSLVVSYSHSDDDIDMTVECIEQALIVYKWALDEGIESYLQGRSVPLVFVRR